MSEIKQVLLVDDDTMMRQLAEISLTKVGGLTVIACDSGENAIKALESFTPDIILLDSYMPGLSGAETLSKIHSLEKYSHIPIVFLTGESRESELNRLKALGATDVIVKPFDPMTLPAQLQAIAAR